MNTLWLKTLRDLWLYRARTLMVVLAIAVGTAAAGVSVTSLIVLRRDLRDGYRATNPAHAILATTPFDPDLAERVARLPEVAAAEERRLDAARLIVPAPCAEAAGGEEGASPSGKCDAPGDAVEARALQLWTLPDEPARVGQLRVEGGAVAAGPGVGELWLERSAGAALALAVGDTLTVRQSDGDTAGLRLAGFVHDMAVAPTTVQPTVYGYIDDATAARLGLPATYDQLHLTVSAANPDRATVERAVTAVAAWLEDEDVVVLRATIPEPGVHLMQSNVDTGLLMVGILGGLTLLLSAFLVTNVMTAVVAQQTPQIGVLKALGGGQGLVLRLYGRMVVIFGVLALLAAVPLGLVGAYFQSTLVAGQLNYDIPSFGLPAATVLVQAAGALAVPLLAALGALRGAARLSVREALASDERRVTSDEFSQRALHSSLVARHSSLVLVALRNVTRRPGRTALTVGALALAGAMFMATFGLRLGLYEAIDILVGEFPYDVQIDLAEPVAAQRLTRAAEGLAGVARAEAWGVADARRLYADGRTGASFTLFGVPPTTQISPFAERAGCWLWEEEAHAKTQRRNAQDPSELCVVASLGEVSSEIYINYEAEKLLARPGVGDDLALWLNGEREAAARLVGISLRPFDPQAYMPYADFERATGQRGRAGRLVIYVEQGGGRAGVQGCKSDLPCPPASQTIADELTARLESAGITVAYVETAESLRTGYRAQFDTLVALIMGLAGLTALVGGLGLGNTMALNVLERSREIGVLRALGARRALLRRLILAEGLFIALLSAVLAVPLAVPLTAALDRVMGVSLLGSPLRFAFAPWAALGWLVLVVVIGVVACWLPAARAGRITIREALAYE